MFRFWKNSGRVKQPSSVPQPRLASPEGSPDAAVDSRKISDTDGKLRRMRQLVEDNRLL